MGPSLGDATVSESSAPHTVLSRVQIKCLLNEYIFQRTTVIKYRVHILALPLSSSICPASLLLSVRLTWWVSSVSPCLPNPHRVWPVGSRGRRSEGQGVPLPQASPRPPQMAEPSSVSHCASEVSPLSLHTTLLPGFHPGFVPLPTGGNSKADTPGTCTITYGALPPTRLNVFL